MGKIYIGIDPGISGAVAFIDKKQVIANDIPTIPITVGNKNKQGYNIKGMVDLLKPYKDKKHHIILEKVWAMPGQGVTSMFNFGMGYGIWLGILDALEMDYTCVPAQTWKKELLNHLIHKDMSKQEKKKQALIHVPVLYPKAAELVKRQKDLGRADAILLAEYGRREK